MAYIDDTETSSSITWSGLPRDSCSPVTAPVNWPARYPARLFLDERRTTLWSFLWLCLMMSLTLCKHIFTDNSHLHKSCPNTSLVMWYDSKPSQVPIRCVIWPLLSSVGRSTASGSTKGLSYAINRDRLKYGGESKQQGVTTFGEEFAKLTACTMTLVQFCFLPFCI